MEKLSTELGIKLPKGPKARRNRPVSWLPVELLDRKGIDKETLSASQGSGLQDAKREAQKYHTELLRLLKTYPEESLF